MAPQDRLRAWEALFGRVLQAIDSVREPGFAGAWSFGGGTVLMRRYRHRLSKDIDIFVPDPQYLGYLDPELNDTVAALTPRYLREANYLRLYFPDGEVDFIAAAPVTQGATTRETVLNREVRVDTSIEVIAKKIRYRAEHFTARDLFDLALVAEKEAEGFARLDFVLNERRDALVERLASGDRILRTTFKALETLDFRPAYDHCADVLRKALVVSALRGRR